MWEKERRTMDARMKGAHILGIKEELISEESRFNER